MGAAVGFGLLLAFGRAAEGPLDDPDQAWQRPGFLDAGELPAPAPMVAPDVSAPGRPTVVFFVRPQGWPSCATPSLPGRCRPRRPPPSSSRLEV